MWPVASTERLLVIVADDTRDDHESKRHTSSDDTVLMTWEFSSASGMSVLTSMRSADAETEKALTHVKVLDGGRRGIS